MLTTSRDQSIPFFSKGIEIGLVGEHCDRDWLLEHFHTLLVEQRRAVDSLSLNEGRRTCGSVALARSNDCGLFLQDSSRLIRA